MGLKEKSHQLYLPSYIQFYSLFSIDFEDGPRNFATFISYCIYFLYILPPSSSKKCRVLHGRQRVRQLRCDRHAFVAPRRHWPLSLQRMRALPQNERDEPATHQAAS